MMMRVKYNLVHLFNNTKSSGKIPIHLLSKSLNLSIHKKKHNDNFVKKSGAFLQRYV